MNVDIVVVTYNHENYIKKCLASIYMQKTKHNVTLYISDDCSTDKTNEIIREVTCNDLFKTIHITHEHNLGINHNYYNVIKKCNSEVILFCEGDDYWVSESRIDNYVKELTKNDDTKGYFSDVNYVSVIDQNMGTSAIEPDSITCSDIIENNRIPGLSSFGVKNTFTIEDNSWFKDCSTPDSLIYILATRNGGVIRKSPNIQSAYRLGSGIWSSSAKVKNLERNIVTFKILKEHMNEYSSYISLIRTRIVNISFSLAVKNFRDRNNKLFVSYYLDFVSNYSFTIKNYLKKIILMGLRLFIHR